MKKVGPLKTTSQSEDLKEKNKHVKRKKKKTCLEDRIQVSNKSVIYTTK